MNSVCELNTPDVKAWKFLWSGTIAVALSGRVIAHDKYLFSNQERSLDGNTGTEGILRDVKRMNRNLQLRSFDDIA